MTARLFRTTFVHARIERTLREGEAYTIEHDGAIRRQVDNLQLLGLGQVPLP